MIKWAPNQKFFGEIARELLGKNTSATFCAVVKNFCNQTNPTWSPPWMFTPNEDFLIIKLVHPDAIKRVLR